MHELDTLEPQQRSQVRELLAVIEDADGVRPTNESADLVISGDRPGRFLLTMQANAVAGVAVLDERDDTIQVAVHPEHRRRGHGTELLRNALRSTPASSVWAFATLPGAEALAAALHLTPARELLKMARPLGHEVPPTVPDGWQIRAYQAEDAPWVVSTNAAAFTHHPEQGKLTLAEFHDLTRQPWFSAAGLLVVAPRYETSVAGFHWTKRHDEHVGEVYVLAVHPDRSGHGLGRALLEAGLAHLSSIGCTEVVLFVEANEKRVVEMYRSASFVTINTDTSYRS